MEKEKSKLKSVSLNKLEKLSDQELLERIKQKDIKVKEKHEYYEHLHTLNMERFETYRKYREEDANVCANILNQRKSNEKKVAIQL